MLRGSIDAARGKREDARKKFQEAAARFATIDMPLHAAASRRRLGELIGDAEGEALVRDADAWFTERGVRNPARMAAIVVPPLRNS
jgi:thioesterase domain-containing protein